MKKALLGIVCIIAISTSCKKTDDTGGCWSCQDNQGNITEGYCADSEDEAYEKAKVGKVNGVVPTREQFNQWCKRK